MSFVNNRRNALVPSREGISLGSDELRWTTVYTSNIDCHGVVRAIKLIGDGKDITNLNIPVLDWDSFGCNIVPDIDGLWEIGTPARRWGSIYSSNGDFSGGVRAPFFRGNGNQLIFDSLATSIYPANSLVTLGNPNQVFDNVYTRRVTAIGDIEANKFIGDGSMITNVPLPRIPFDNLNADIIPASNGIYNLGTPNLRFGCIFTNNIHSLQALGGGKLCLTRPVGTEGLPIEQYEQCPANGPISTGLPDDINERLGGTVDLAVRSEIVDILVVGELYSYKTTMMIPTLAPVMSNISPHIAHQFDVGTVQNPFRQGHFDFMFLYNDLTVNGNLICDGDVACGTFYARGTANFDMDVNVAGTITTQDLMVDGNIITNGSIIAHGPFISPIGRVGPLSSNVVPEMSDTYDIGSSNLAFNNVYARRVVGLETVKARNLDVSDDTLLRGHLYMGGNMYGRDGERINGTKSGYLVPSLQTFSHYSVMKYSYQRVSPFINIKMETGELMCRSPGLYNVAAYAWRTTRGINDMDISWRVRIKTIYNNSVVHIYLKGSDSKSFVLHNNDTFAIEVFPGFEPDSSELAAPLTVYPSGAIVVSQLTVLDPFIEATIVS